MPFGLSQKKVILDTDPGYDPDDVGCMAMLQTMASLGECEILAIINSTYNKESAPSISAINSFYNRSAIPVGDYKGYPQKIDVPKEKYTYLLNQQYPKTLESWEEAYDGVALYREVLASAADTSITVIIIGTMHNFYGLLHSSADEFSDLNGVDLVEKKVQLVVTMGGNFIDGEGYDRTNWGGANALCEYTSWSCLNEERNRMCRYVIDHCPAPFMASGWEVGCGDYHNANYGNVMTGQGLKQLETNHIVRRSYEYHFKHVGSAEKITRHSNDQCALHYAVRGEADNYIAYKNGDIRLTEGGVCTWNAGVNKKQGYIQKRRDKLLIAEEIEALMMGDILKKDLSPPTKPTNLKYVASNGQRSIRWSPSADNTKGSWVIGYNVYHKKKRIGTAYGHQFIIADKWPKKRRLKIKAINASGTESLPSRITIR